MEVRISVKYRKSSDPRLLKQGYQISDTMKDNPVFPDPKPAQSVLQEACDDFRIASSMAGRKDLALLSAKNDKKAVLIGMIDELAEYVTATCKGDKTILLKSVF